MTSYQKHWRPEHRCWCRSPVLWLERNQENPTRIAQGIPEDSSFSAGNPDQGKKECVQDQATSTEK